MLLSALRGQNTAVRTLERALARDRLPNAYLFDGPAGVGKQAAALALAMARVCPTTPGKGCGKCPVCTRILANNHPDVRVFAPREDGNRNLQVETLRSEILQFCQFAPFEARHAFVIFPEADVSFPEQHPHAANALLKTLEEPRPGICFVLLSERPERLLVTIRSRCQRVRFGPLPRMVLEHVLEQEGVHADHWAAAIALAEGRADRVVALTQGGLAASLLTQALRIDKVLSTRDAGRLVELSEELAKASDLPLVLETLATFYRDVAVSALGLTDQLRFYAQRADIEARAKELTPQAAAQRVARLAEHPELLSKNANPQIALDNLLMELAQIA